MRRLASVAAILALATAGVAALPHDANAWWRGGGVGIGIYLPPVIVGPPAYTRRHPPITRRRRPITHRRSTTRRPRPIMRRPATIGCPPIGKAATGSAATGARVRSSAVDPTLDVIRPLHQRLRLR